MTDKNQKTLAALSFDMDNMWSYMKTHGDAGWESYPSYFDILIPKVTKVLEKRNLNITFFIVGKDAADEKNKEALLQLKSFNHEIGNHSFYHEPWLHLYDKFQIDKEIKDTNEALENIFDKKPVGFRGPGFSWSNDLLEVLLENGFKYDGSTLPTYLSPLARLYYMRTANLSKEEKEKRAKLFGSFKDGFRPVKPYYLELQDKSKILEIPVTTMPTFKIPFHLSYLVYLAGYSKGLMKFYLNTVLTMCRLSKTSPSFLLHPLDFLGGDEIPELKFFPGMQLSGKKKEEIFTTVMDMLSKHYEFVNMKTYAEAISKNKLKTKPV